jgi:hypothetical protein
MFFPPVCHAEIGGPDARLSQKMGMLASFLLFVDFRRCRMTGLPMLTVRPRIRGN